MATPHFKPEIIAQTTLVDFSVTQSGLEEQILAVVVDKEHPELERYYDRYLLIPELGTAIPHCNYLYLCVSQRA